MCQHRTTAGENWNTVPRIGNRSRLGTLSKAAVLLPILLLFVGFSTAAHGQACQTPLFIQAGQVEANVMVLFDNSGSMNEAMYHPDFDPNVNYSGPYGTSSIYYIYTEGWRHLNNRDAWLIRGPNGQPGRYVGNYLNWIYYNASEDQRLDIPRDTRMDVAHQVVTDIIDRSSGVRFGLANFYSSSGGYIRAECGTDKEDLIDEVWDIAGTTWTPLAETMEDVLDYFRKTGSCAPIQAKCQKNFLIVMTDGFPTKDVSISSYLRDADQDGNDPGSCASIGAMSYGAGSECSDHMDDVAYWMRHNDLRSDLGTPGESWEDGQNVVTYAIGFGVDAQLLYDTAENGDGLYLLAENAAELWTSLELIMLDIISRISSGAAVAVVSTERGDDNYLYRGKFMPGEWTGFLESFALPYETGDIPTWEAGYLLSQRTAGSRQIFTGIGSTEFNFSEGQAGSLVSKMGASDASEAAALIKWARGDNVFPYRLHENNWKLGDIIHSTPVVVGAPSAYVNEESYQEYLTDNINREKIIYVGSNDGMLHAFRASNGQEKWAFVPEFTLPKFSAMADTNYCHQYSCDLTPSVTDVKIGGSWRTVLVSGGREGGAGYFALDITSPNSPSLLWQITLPNNKAFGSEVKFGMLDDIPVAFIGSGLDTTDGDAFLYEYNLLSGALLGQLHLSALGSGNRNKATGATVADLDMDGETDVAYIADLSGTVHRIDFEGTTNIGSWSISELFSGSQAISATPVAAYGDAGNVNVYFGTGTYLDDSDLVDPQNNTFYCIFDQHDGAENPSLADQTNSIHDIGSADGWYIDLEREQGERVTEPAAVVAGAVFYTSFVPSAEPCEAGGHSWLTRAAFGDGSVPDDGEEDAFEGDRQIDMGDGVASRAVVDIINEKVIIQSSDATITIQDIGNVFFNLTVKSWQENYDHVTDTPAEEVIE